MDMTQVMEAAITIVTAVITVFVVPFLRKKLSSQELQILTTWVEIAVRAAEQVYGDKEGIAKKQYVLNFLNSKGYTVDSDEVNNLIEASVHKMTSELKEKVS